MSMPSKMLLLEERIDKIEYSECDSPFHLQSDMAKLSISTDPEMISMLKLETGRSLVHEDKPPIGTPNGLSGMNLFKRNFYLGYDAFQNKNQNCKSDRNERK